MSEPSIKPELLNMPFAEDGGPAHPITLTDANGSIYHLKGISVRDYFAAMALQGLLPDAANCGQWPNIAAECYAAADAMLEARKRGQA